MRVDEAVSGGKPPAGKSVDSLTWLTVCFTFCKVRHGDIKCNMVIVSPNQIIIIIIIVSDIVSLICCVKHSEFVVTVKKQNSTSAE